MSIHLYRHNEDAYQAAERMLDEKGMAAVIHPTGSGKSMIAFKLAERHSESHFLWLSPSEYIYQTVGEYRTCISEYCLYVLQQAYEE